MSHNSLPAQTGLAEPSVPPPSSEASAADCTLFISYRTDPDQPLAVALKEQLEQSLEPAPRVFVSGYGGLLPSRASWNAQLQRAVQSAKAIIGIITPASKQREWLIFEAGAAWGRGILYAPLLVGTSASDTPSMLSSYQSIQAEDSTAVATLLESLAGQLGARVRKPLRLQRLKHAIRAYLGLAPGKDEEHPGDQSEEMRKEAMRALDLAHEGKREEASQIFQDLEAQAVTPDDRVLVHAVRLWSDDDALKESRHLLNLTQLEEPLKNTSEYHFWRAQFDVSPTKKLEHLQRCLDLKGRADTRREAYLALVALQRSLGRAAVAERLLLEGMLGEDRHLAALCAIDLEEQLSEKQPLAKLTVLVAGMCAHPSAALLDRLSRLSQGQDWGALALYMTQKFEDTFADDTSANNLGIILEQHDLLSLAYEAYLKSVERGSSVAKANIARVVGGSAVPLVGLKMLEAHSGEFDAATPNYPHEVRADLEKRVHSERKQLEKLDHHGLKLFQMFAMLVEKGLATQASELLSGSKYRWKEGSLDAQWRELTYDCTVESSGKVTLSVQGAPSIELTPIFPGRGFFQFTAEKIQGFMSLIPGGGFEGSPLSLKSTTGVLEWFELTRA